MGVSIKEKPSINSESSFNKTNYSQDIMLEKIRQVEGENDYGR